MKNYLFIIGVIISVILNSECISQTYTPGTLTFKFTPVSHNGYSGTKNVLAVWIQTDSNDFVKTKLRYVGGGTDDHLPIWGANAGCNNPYSVTSSSCNTTDAITGATLSSFTSRTVTWDGKNVNGTMNGTTVIDGVYKVSIEECWNHGSSGKTNISYTFTKGPNEVHLAPANTTHFTNVTLDWVPDLLPLSASILTTNDSFGNCNGTATVTVSGGMSPYTYLWSTSPVQSTSVATGLCAGIYSVTVTDSLLNSTVVTGTINASGTALSGTVTTTNDFYGKCNGTATANASGGQSPYTYKWSTTPEQTTKMATGLCAGNYNVTITDALLNTVIASGTVSSTGTALSCTASATNATYGNCNGTATANPAGGESPYSYKWSTTPMQTTKTASGLCAGTYYVTVTDAQLDTVVVSAVVNATGTALTCTTTSTGATAGNCNGTATAQVSGGLAPYTYKWSTTPIQTTGTATGLCAGTYTVTVTDAASNTATSTAVITSIVGIDQAQQDSTIKIFPNPTNGIFSISFKYAANIKIENALGETIYEEGVKKGNNEMKIDLSGFPNGNYFISIGSEDKTSKYSIVLNK